MHALRATNWNLTKTARVLHWSRTTVYRKVAKYGVERPTDAGGPPPDDACGNLEPEPRASFLAVRLSRPFGKSAGQPLWVSCLTATGVLEVLFRDAAERDSSGHSESVDGIRPASFDRNWRFRLTLPGW